ARGTGETDLLRSARVIVSVGDDAVTDHRAAKEFERGKLLCQRKLLQLGSLRDIRYDSTMSAVGGLSDPPSKRQARPFDEIEQLGYGVGTVLRMQKRIGECGLLPEIRGFAQQSFERMPGWQRLESGGEGPNLR